MNELVRRLSEGQHKVVVSCRPEATAKAFEAAIERGYVHIKFTETRGGTELGVAVDKSRMDLSGADFENQSGTVAIEGEITLDYVPVRLIATIDLAGLSGWGNLELREPG